MAKKGIPLPAEKKGGPVMGEGTGDFRSLNTDYQKGSIESGNKATPPSGEGTSDFRSLNCDYCEK
jgi:hypothetical protein